jgi:hypothetical protein
MKLPFLWLSVFFLSGSINTNSKGFTCNSSDSEGDKTINSLYSGSVPDDSKKNADVYTPEMFGAVGDGQPHLLSEKFRTLAEAQKIYPGVIDLKVTVDGAAFQKAVDIASGEHKTVIAEKKYATNFPIITRNNTTIDGNNKGLIINDRSRKNLLFNLAFFIGDHSASAFTKDADPNGYNFYDLKGGLTPGQTSVELANSSDAGSFKAGQLVMVCSSVKTKQAGKNAVLPYHVTMSKIVKIEGTKLYFEYPINEQVNSAQIAANGGFDKTTDINFGGVENVTIRNLNIDASQITGRAYGYKITIDNVNLNGGVRLIGINAMAHSTFSNITGTFSWRCMEIKTGTSDITVRNVNATYKPLPNYPQVVDAISIGEYNRDVKIDSFKIDFGNGVPKIALINLRSRKAVISNGVIICKNQKTAFVNFHNDRVVADPKFACYKNLVKNVKFYGSSNIKSVLAIGDEPKNNKNPNKQNNWAAQKSKMVKQNKNAEDDDMSINDEQGTENTPPTDNTVEDCLFDGGAPDSYADLIDGSNNTLQNCTFTKAKLKIHPNFKNINTVANNKSKGNIQ